MPVAVPVTFKQFLALEEKMKSMGFVEIHRCEMAVIMKAFGLKPSREARPGEIGYKCTFHGYTVKVWTTCLRHVVEGCRQGLPGLSDETIVSRPAGEDVGWVLIVDSWGRSQYFARPVMRTKRFVRTLLRRTWIAQRKIKKRPLCRTCGKFMEICVNRSGGTFWGCYRRALHPNGESVTERWDFNLPPKALKMAEAWRNEFDRYLRAAKKEGKTPRRASEVRKPWRTTKNPF